MVIKMLDDKLLEKNVGDEFTCTGMWWVPRLPCPKNPKSTVYGTLTLTSEGKYELSTVGALDFEQSQGLAFIEAGKFPRLKTIWGATTSGEFITLFDSDNTHWSTSACTYQATTVIATKSKRWFASVDDVAFDRLRLGYKHLVAWAGASRFTPLRPEDCYGAESGSSSYSIKRPLYSRLQILAIT